MENSKIAWTNHTYNPWIGCTKVSLGCDNCYAEDLMDLRYKRVVWGQHGERARTKTAAQVVRWNKAAATEPIRPRVFCASLSDIFDNQVPSGWRSDLWTLIASCPNLNFLLLTKRPQNIRDMLPDDWDDGWPNVWLGTTVENQREADRRIPYLRDVPAVVHFLSAEPLLEEIHPDLCGVQWVICGGESGSKARLFLPHWARSLHSQCDVAGVRFFFKQTGSLRLGWPSGVTGKGEDPEEWPSDLRIREYPDR